MRSFLVERDAVAAFASPTVKAAQQAAEASMRNKVQVGGDFCSGGRFSTRGGTAASCASEQSRKPAGERGAVGQTRRRAGETWRKLEGARCVSSWQSRTGHSAPHNCGQWTG
jgi:hypothetical protein